MIKLKKESYLIILFVISLSALVSAYITQYLLGYQPCNLCLIERIPYILCLIIVILNFKFKENQNFFSVLLFLIFLFSLLISIYHFGIEQGLVPESDTCKYNNSLLLTKDDILKSFQEITISCKDVALKIFGFSLTSYNILVSLIMILISIKIYLINDKIKK